MLSKFVLFFFFILSFSFIKVISESEEIAPFQCKNFETINLPYEEFLGQWYFLRYFTKVSLKVNPKCLKLDNSISSLTNYPTMTLNMSFFDTESGSILNTNSDFYLRYDPDDKKAFWNLYSNNELVPSNLIILKKINGFLLFIICSDYPDNEVFVGEIGILSRNVLNLSAEHFEEFLITLRKYNLNTHYLSQISHQECLRARGQDD